MKHFFLIILIGAFAVLVFDTIGSLASRNFGFPYYWLTVGSFLIYAGVGLAASKYNGLMYAPLAAGIVGLIDSTLGWYISWVIGPGRPEIEMDLMQIFTAIIFVTVLASLFGFVGEFVSRWI